ncbi:hypothetical protein HY440_00665 [Candidatus Microgenomates bacterium]|nr:hypothetical protein [Candidatus Microgenomates bacterium]
MKLKLICLLAFLLFLPAIGNYFSHDDFFNLLLGRANGVGDVLRFFDPIHAPERVGSYRPLTTQIYFLVSHFFNQSPLPLHIIAFLVFFVDIFLVYKLTKMLLTQEKPALIAAFLYAVSNTHFAHLYWPSLFQETGLIFFFLLSVVLFLDKHFFWSFLAMIGGLMSKETAIMIPIVLTLVVFLQNKWSQVWKLIPYYFTTGVFLFVHLVFFGLPPGSVYTLDFSAKVLNTLMWYGLWAFNLPEMFVDFVGPGLRLNPNLLRFYGFEVTAIMVGFLATIVGLIFSWRRPTTKFALFCLGWFIATLLPVIFLPWHKFTYELGVPLVGLVFLLAWFLTKTSRRVMIFFCLAWLATSWLTLQLTARTHWITQGPPIAKRVERYFVANEKLVSKNVVFYDTADDISLPWSPANEVKINLSDQDFFEVYYPGRFTVTYLQKTPEKFEPETSYIPARQFLGY